MTKTTRLTVAWKLPSWATDPDAPVGTASRARTSRVAGYNGYVLEVERYGADSHRWTVYGPSLGLSLADGHARTSTQARAAATNALHAILVRASGLDAVADGTIAEQANDEIERRETRERLIPAPRQDRHSATFGLTFEGRRQNNLHAFENTTLKVRLTPAQISALECRPITSIEPEDAAIRACWVGQQIVFHASEYEPLSAWLTEASNAEDGHAQESTDPDTRRFAFAASRSLAAIASALLRAIRKAGIKFPAELEAEIQAERDAHQPVAEDRAGWGGSECQ